MRKKRYILLLCVLFACVGCGKEMPPIGESQNNEHISTNESGDICEAGHKEEVIIGKTATCTEIGLTDGKKCSVCGTVTVAQKEIVANGHSEATVSGKTATCTANGLTDGKKCSICGIVIVAQEEISATGHTYTDDVDLECSDCGYVRGYWSDWIDNGIEPVIESNLREIKKREINVSSTKYRYKRCIWYSSNGVFSSSKRPPSGYTEGTAEKGSNTYKWDYSNWHEVPIEVEYKYYDGVTATETYVSDGVTYYEEIEEVADTEVGYRYSRCIWYSTSGIFSSSKRPPSGYTEGMVGKGSKTYSWDYSDWYDTAIEVEWVYYNGSSTATSTYNCDGTTYYNEEIGETPATETHYFYREIVFY